MEDFWCNKLFLCSNDNCTCEVKFKYVNILQSIKIIHKEQNESLLLTWNRRSCLCCALCYIYWYLTFSNATKIINLFDTKRWNSFLPFFYYALSLSPSLSLFIPSIPSFYSLYLYFWSVKCCDQSFTLLSITIIRKETCFTVTLKMILIQIIIFDRILVEDKKTYRYYCDIKAFVH